LHCVVDSIDDSQFEEFSKLEAVQLACKGSHFPCLRTLSYVFSLLSLVFSVRGFLEN
jgi:hypothetical protein